MTRLRIGITRCHRIADYVEAVAASGAEPVLLEVNHGSEGLLNDVVIVNGEAVGQDPDPAIRGQLMHQPYQNLGD